MFLVIKHFFFNTNKSLNRKCFYMAFPGKSWRIMEVFYMRFEAACMFSAVLASPPVKDEGGLRGQNQQHAWIIICGPCDITKGGFPKQCVVLAGEEVGVLSLLKRPSA